MKTTGSAAAIAALLVTALASAPALAWHHSRVRVGIGFNFGVPVAAFPYYYPVYYPYYYPPVVLQQRAPVYVEQGLPPAAQPAPQGYWYYCADARAYYPYVKECPGGWQRVAPQPQS